VVVGRVVTVVMGTRVVGVEVGAATVVAVGSAVVVALLPLVVVRCVVVSKLVVVGSCDVVVLVVLLAGAIRPGGRGMLFTADGVAITTVVTAEMVITPTTPMTRATTPLSLACLS